MMEGVRSWLLGLICVSLACALAKALMPPGAVRRVGRLVCGLAMMLAILAPLTRVDVLEGEAWVEGFLDGSRLEAEELERQVNGQMKAVIEARCAAYIVDKGALFGLSCTAQVECREEEGVCLPERAVVTAAAPEEARNRLRAAIAQDLGIPEEKIVIEEGFA